MVKNKLSGLLLIVLSVLIFSGCGTSTQKAEDKNAAPENVISAELHQAQCDLLSKANEELAGINQKVRDLNDKIREKGMKFTVAQNTALDSFEVKQASINKRMHEIKTIRQEEWENFKSIFENDLNDINSIIDNLLNGL